MQAWIARRGDHSGPLFLKIQSRSGEMLDQRLGPDGLVERIKWGARQIGLNVHFYAGHSLRSGFVTAAAENGASELAIMQRTGHRSIQMVHRYFRPVTAFSVNPLANVL